jgi:hypothetical protein
MGCTPDLIQDGLMTAEGAATSAAADQPLMPEETPGRDTGDGYGRDPSQFQLGA